VNIDYGGMLDEHVAAEVSATMAVREYEYEIPYGVVQIASGNILGLEEKPVHKVMVNAGVYVLSPDVISKVPRETFFNMPELFEALITEGQPTRCHSVHGYWLDIGRHKDFERACADFKDVFE
jgi:NDP-sugar pyrophosphorylase family protein